MAVILTANDLHKSYGARTVLERVSLAIDDRERLGLVGANGTGKSTLGRILARVEEPDGGEVVTRRAARVAYLPQEPRFDGDPSAREAVLAGLTAWTAAKARYEAALHDLDALHDAQEELERLGGYDRAHDAEAMLDRLGVSDHDRRVSTLSGGERRRVDLARLLVSRPDLAILDEPTNHLDVDTIEWLEGHLADDQPGALVLITHDRYFLDRIVTRTAELARGELAVYDGGYEAYLEAKAEREAHDARAESNRQNLLRRELEWLRSSAPARTTKQKARMDRAHATIAAEPAKKARAVSLAVDTVRTGKTVVDLDHVHLRVGDRVLVDDLTLSITPGERVGIVGPNGAGKTTLLRAILGELEPARGTIVRGQSVRITYLGQRREGLDERASIMENVAGGQSRVTLGERTMDARAYLDRFLFSGEAQRQPVGSLSGGEKARVLLAKLLLQPTNLFVLDEPTNDLDVTTLSALEELLLEMNGTALVVTHDRWFLDRVATSILAFEGGGRVLRYAGGYTRYKEVRAAPKIEATPTERAERPKRAKTGLTYGERIELDGILDKIAEAEAKVSAIEAELADPSLYAGGGDRATRLMTDLAAAKSGLDALMARWEALETKKSEARDDDR